MFYISIEMEKIDSKALDIIAQVLQQDIARWKENWDYSIWEQIEYNIFIFWIELANIYWVYTVNNYNLEKKKWELFLKDRKNQNSDRATTINVNKMLAWEIAVVAWQENKFKEMEMKLKAFTRFWNFIKDKQIKELAEAKRQEMSVSDKFNSRQ